MRQKGCFLLVTVLFLALLSSCVRVTSDSESSTPPFILTDKDYCSMFGQSFDSVERLLQDEGIDYHYDRDQQPGLKNGPYYSEDIEGKTFAVYLDFTQYEPISFIGYNKTASYATLDLDEAYGLLDRLIETNTTAYGTPIRGEDEFRLRSNGERIRRVNHTWSVDDEKKIILHLSADVASSNEYVIELQLLFSDE